MITAREISGHLREAQARALNLYWKPLGAHGAGYGVRIIRARTRKGTVEVLALGSGTWHAITNGDAFYIQ